MQNIETKITNGKLTLTMDLGKRLGKSASGKSMLIATTSGNVVIDANSGATLGLNLYTKQMDE